MTNRGPILRRLPALCLSLLVVIAAGSAANAFEIKEVRSPGGIKAWLVEDHTLQLMAMRFSFRGGASADPADKNGATYFLSNMLAEGAGDMDTEAFHKKAEDLGLKLNFNATLDLLSGSFQATTDKRDESLDFLKTTLTAPRFDAAPMEKVRQQINVVIRNDETEPNSVGGTLWMKRAFPDHPYGRPNTGTLDSVATITADDLRAQAKRMMARDNLVVSVVGDIDPETLGRLLDQTFGSLPEKSDLPKVAPATVRKVSEVRVVDLDIPQSIITFGHQGIRYDDPDYLTAMVMNAILGGDGFVSRLMGEIRDKRGLTYGVYTFLFSYQNGELYAGSVATVNERAGEVLALTRAEFRRMAEDGPTEAELESTKKYLTGAYALRFDGNANIASELQGMQIDKLGIDYVTTRNKTINAITVEDVRKMARRLLDTDNMIVTVVGRPKDIVQTGN